ncbi:hypothetical protein SAMN05216402_0916 [Nitrosospira multiformis]|uniref:Uncharacterized protein n=1 Tax=Nitrosospira multiformis TaxID=1231 RepID=A0ABY0TAS0_9PROT|nr:hypothetical protein SAMN05216402_0916 [Nitrosospira multiformis]
MCNTEEDRCMVNGYLPLVNSSEMNKLIYRQPGKMSGPTSVRMHACCCADISNLNPAAVAKSSKG